MTDDGRRLSPSRLATYGTCPRQYEYDKVWDVETPEEARRYMDRGLIYHAAIEEICDTVRESPGDFTDAEIRDLALDVVTTKWDAGADRAEYHSDAQFAYDRSLTVAAIDSFFQGDGLDHARNSVATEETVTWDQGDRCYKGRVDHVVRTDDGLHVYDYKGSLSRIISGHSAQSIPDHLEGEEFLGGKLKNLFQAAIYIEGAKNLDVYEPGMDVGFSFYGVMHSTSRQGHPDGLQVSVSGSERDVTWIYETYREEIHALLARCYDGITNREFEPARFEDIREHACGDCAYRAMCGDYLSAEVGIDE